MDGIDECIQHHRDEALTLRSLSKRLGYSEVHTTRKFREITGMRFRDYLRLRRLAHALIEVRDTGKKLLDIAVDYGFSSHEAFTRAFKAAYGTTPKEYRRHPVPVVLRIKVNTFDRYFLGIGEIGMIKSTAQIRIGFVTIPAHKFLHIKNYDSNGYWDFWEKQDRISGQDCDTICGLLYSIKGKLETKDGETGQFGGHCMAHIFEKDGRCPECYGVRLPAGYCGEVPSQMLLVDIPEGDYIVFEHGPFDYEQENTSVGDKMQKAMDSFNFSGTGYCPDESTGRISFGYHDPQRFMKFFKPVKRK